MYVRTNFKFKVKTILHLLAIFSFSHLVCNTYVNKSRNAYIRHFMLYIGVHIRTIEVLKDLISIRTILHLVVIFVIFLPYLYKITPDISVLEMLILHAIAFVCYGCTQSYFGKYHKYSTFGNHICCLFVASMLIIPNYLYQKL